MSNNMFRATYNLNWSYIFGTVASDSWKLLLLFKLEMTMSFQFYKTTVPILWTNVVNAFKLFFIDLKRINYNSDSMEKYVWKFLELYGPDNTW